MLSREGALWTPKEHLEFILEIACSSLSPPACAPSHLSFNKKKLEREILPHLPGTSSLMRLDEETHDDRTSGSIFSRLRWRSMLAEESGREMKGESQIGVTE